MKKLIQNVFVRTMELMRMFRPATLSKHANYSVVGRWLSSMKKPRDESLGFDGLKQ